MEQKDKELEKTLIEPQTEAEGIRRRTFLKELLAAGAVTSLSGLGLMDLSRAEAAGETGPAKERNLYQKVIGPTSPTPIDCFLPPACRCCATRRTITSITTR